MYMTIRHSILPHAPMLYIDVITYGPISVPIYVHVCHLPCMGSKQNGPNPNNNNSLIRKQRCKYMMEPTCM